MPEEAQRLDEETLKIPLKHTIAFVESMPGNTSVTATVVDAGRPQHYDRRTNQCRRRTADLDQQGVG